MRQISVTKMGYHLSVPKRDRAFRPAPQFASKGENQHEENTYRYAGPGYGRYHGPEHGCLQQHRGQQLFRRLHQLHRGEQLHRLRDLRVFLDLRGFRDFRGEQRCFRRGQHRFLRGGQHLQRGRVKTAAEKGPGKTARTFFYVPCGAVVQNAYRPAASWYSRPSGRVRAASQSKGTAISNRGCPAS